MSVFWFLIIIIKQEVATVMRWLIQKETNNHHFQSFRFIVISINQITQVNGVITSCYMLQKNNLSEST